ncbi:MAG: Ni/Fe-hydrogenase cytochrome b subunit [Kiritimatiellae bacterium]|nr:Ni/Fe-hydrogenase cytochrome b subunit [Kiritimatiellia bacterium]MDD5521151.1 Ni/Fe-hydrogenase cytochrome b subunit [Kiritimatiellia bacterium]
MHHEDYQKHEGDLFTKSFFVLLAFVLMGGYLLAVRCIKGIGAVSGMSDGFPWGIWLTYDVATGTAMACGGYAVAILVYIRHHMHYHPLIRSCILTSMFGYGFAGISVMIDLGRPWNVYNFFVPSQWQFNSALFEVALCVMAYTVVLIIEFLPAILYSLEKSEWLRLRTFIDWLHPSLAPKKETLINHIDKVRKAAGWIRPLLEKVLIFFIVLGITLPTMHQSSLGSMLLIATTKLNPLWHTGFLPLLFLINCIYIGYSMVILESLISCYAFKRPYEAKELSGIASIIPWLTAIWMTVVIGDLAWRGQLAAAVRFDFYSFFFLLEFALVAFGSLILFNRRNRLSLRTLFISAVMIVLGGGLYRFNVYLIGYNPGPGWTYFPSLAELGITVSIVAFEILGYQVLVKLVPVLPKIHLHSHGKPVEHKIEQKISA